MLIEDPRGTTRPARAQEASSDDRQVDQIGRIAANIAHHFNNLHFMVLGQAEILLAALPTSDPLRKNAEAIVAAVHRAAALTANMLAAARRQHGTPRALDLNDVVEAARHKLVELGGSRLEIVTSPKPALTFADGSQVEWVLLELVRNAVQASESARVIVRVEAAPVARGKLEQPPAGLVGFTVADTGLGMSMEALSHLFTPFFSTKPGAAGLGLAASEGLMRQAGGCLVVNSIPGQGTAVTALLPRRILSQPRQAVETLKSRRAFCVLVVDDEELHLQLLEHILKRAGFQVVTAVRAEQALELVRSRPGTIDLVMTDVCLPGTNGAQLGAILARSHPDIRMIYISGYPYDTLLQRKILVENVEFLQKPFGTRALLRKVNRVLGLPDTDPL